MDAMRKFWRVEVDSGRKTEDEERLFFVCACLVYGRPDNRPAAVASGDDTINDRDSTYQASLITTTMSQNHTRAARGGRVCNLGCPESKVDHWPGPICTHKLNSSSTTLTNPQHTPRLYLNIAFECHPESIHRDVVASHTRTQTSTRIVGPPSTLTRHLKVAPVASSRAVLSNHLLTVLPHLFRLRLTRDGRKLTLFWSYGSGYLITQSCSVEVVEVGTRLSRNIFYHRRVLGRIRAYPSMFNSDPVHYLLSLLPAEFPVHP